MAYMLTLEMKYICNGGCLSPRLLTKTKAHLEITVVKSVLLTTHYQSFRQAVSAPAYIELSET